MFPSLYKIILATVKIKKKNLCYRSRLQGNQSAVGVGHQGSVGSIGVASITVGKTSIQRLGISLPLLAPIQVAQASIGVAISVAKTLGGQVGSSGSLIGRVKGHRRSVGIGYQLGTDGAGQSN